MQSQNPNGESPLREILDGVRREYHVAPHDESTESVGDGAQGFVFELETQSEPKKKKATDGDDFSFIDHLSSREIYQMPTEDIAPVWNTYVPRFSDTTPTPPPEAPARQSVAEAEENAPETPQKAPKAKGPRVILLVDHSQIDTGEDRISLTRHTPTADETVHIEPSAAQISPILSTSATAEEDFTSVQGQVTVVEIGQSADEGEDVFVLPKRMQSRTQEGSAERTEEDERREILATISPLSSTEPEALQQPAVPEEVTPVGEEVYTAEEALPDPVEASEPPIEETAPVEAVPSVPVIEEQSPIEHSDIFAHISPDYDMPKASDAPKDGLFSSEFTSYAQQPHIKDAFLDKILSVKVRLACAGILTLALLVLALLPEFGIHLVEKFSLYNIPGVLALMDMQGVLCLFVLAFPELIRACRDIFKGKVRSEFYMLVTFILMICYTVFIVILKPVEYPLFGSLFGILTCVAILSSLYMHKAQFMSFKVISIPEEKNVYLSTPTRSLVHENFALDGIIDEYKSRCARSFRASFLDGFFEKNRKTSENSVKILTYVCISLLSSLFVGIVAYILKDMKAALYSFMSALMFSTPIFYMLSHKLSYFEAERYALSEDATVVGEKSFEGYAAVDVVTYLDTEIFGVEDVALRRFKLIGEEKDFTKPLRQMASLFGAVGGPLATLFDNALERRFAPSEDVIVESDGIYGTVDGVPVLAGSEAFMYRHGIEIPADETAHGIDSTPTTKVLYSAEGNRVHAKFYIRYSFSEEFTMILPSLREAGITPLVYTRDPNITNELLKALTLGGANIRVMKKYNTKDEDAPLYSRLDGGIVTMGDKMDMLNMILLCKRYRKFTLRTEHLLSVATLAGVLLGGAISLLLSPTLPVWVYLLWHCAWVGASAILARATFHLPKNSQKEQ